MVKIDRKTFTSIFQGLKVILQNEHFKKIRVIYADGESALHSAANKKKLQSELGKFLFLENGRGSAANDSFSVYRGGAYSQQRGGKTRANILRSSILYGRW